MHYCSFLQKRNLQDEKQLFNKVTNVSVTLKKTRRGQIHRVLNEIYLRDDIACGIANCNVCKPFTNLGILSQESPCILILTKDVALYQIDFVCNDVCVTNAVLPTSVLDEVKSQNGHFGTRLGNLAQQAIYDTTDTDSTRTMEKKNSCRYFYVFVNHIFRATHTPRLAKESLEEYSERQVFAVARWYRDHLISSFGLSFEQAKEKILVLTNTSSKALKACEQNVRALSVFEYCVGMQGLYPLAGENLVPVDEDAMNEGENASRAKPSGFMYSPHYNLEQIHEKMTQGLLHKGIIRMDRNSHYCATLQTTSLGEIRILGHKYINRAIHGDVVVVELLKDVKEKNTEAFCVETTQVEDAVELLDEDVDGTLCKEKIEKNVKSHLDETSKIYGKVVGIVRRNWKQYAGTLLPLQESQNIRGAAFTKMERKFQPWDPRIPCIILQTRQSLHLDGKRIIVAIDHWNSNHRYPSGHWVHVLGNVNDPDVEAKVILNEFDVTARDFTDAVLRCLPSSDYVIPPEEFKRRKDLRSIMTCSIDPPGCKDIDDALSCETLPNGNIFVAVNIADVTHFVLPDTALDREAAQRCTTVYLVDRRTDMLPALLTTDLCSLVDNVDRLSFSVLWEISPCGTILKTSFEKTVIRSRKAMTYEEAQTLLDDASDNTLLKQCLFTLNSLAKKLRRKRMLHGALELASLEVKFQLDSETHSPNDVDVYHVRDTNKLVEEFMLLANSSVAEFILQKLPLHSVLRRHPPPKVDQLQTLQKLLEQKGFPNFKYTTSQELSQSLDSFCSAEDIHFNKLIRVLTTRCMNQAVYVCSGETAQNCCDESNTFQKNDPNGNISQYYHYGLATSLYTHFTSPIRRYADILVHRLLAVALDLIVLPSQLATKSLIAQQCEQMNTKHRNAQYASRSSVKFFTYRYFKNFGAFETDAIITNVKKNGVSVIIPRYGIEGVVFFKSENYQWSSESQTLTYVNQEKENESLSIFDHIWIKIFADNENFRPTTVLEFLYKTPKNLYINSNINTISIEEIKNLTIPSK
ncbi:uncharacterized protein LOC128883949 [Hylaeus volcanicus]|uniref:uncharacterized protein LOC128883949 n=1 Tax=Hylaeus volcanicus TaxID=313075 RepID=UPI0023B82FDD|nr:uncharacterized protein LOC128883949 [Hylaeus volcanicus]